MVSPQPPQDNNRELETCELRAWGANPRGLGSFTAIGPQVPAGFVDTAKATSLTFNNKHFINATRVNDHFRLDLELAYF